MTDEEYVLKETNKERKSMANGSRYKKNGSKSKKCTLPHENQTRKELAAMNSEVKTIKLNHFYTWEEFLGFKNDIKVEYVENLMAKYGCSLYAISEEVFGLSKTTLNKYMTNHNLRVKKSTVRGMKAEEARNKLRGDVIMQRSGVVLFKEPSQYIAIDVDGEPLKHVKVNDGTAEKEDQEAQNAPFTSVTLTMAGFDDSVMVFLKEKFKGKTVSVTISVNEVYNYSVSVL